jgi:ABC-type phosphate transport system permease subunit
MNNTVTKEKHTQTEVEVTLLAADCAKKCRISRWIFKKTWHLIVAIIVAIIGSLIAAILLDIFGNLGWTERITDFIYRIFLSK